jgi:hypothetical protein
MSYVIPSSGKTACSQMIAAAKSFVGDFTEGRDYIGLVVFSAGVYSYPPTTTFNTKDAKGNTIPSLINSIACGGNTATATALHAGYKAMQDAYTAGLSAGRANIIVLMTDGRPNGVDGNFTPYAVNSTCGKNNLTGNIAQWAGGAVPNGDTAGIMNHTNPDDSGGDNTISAPNCNFDSGGSNSGIGTTNAKKMPQDINQIPNQDIYGNYTITNSGANYTSYTSQNPNDPWYNKEPVLAGANGSNHGPNGPFDIAAASINAADSQGITIRSDTTLKPQIYVIAVIGTSTTDIPDTLFLQKMANYGLSPNDATAKKFSAAQSTQTKGYYVAAPDPSQIDAAFQQVAAQIGMRLAQ